MVKLLSLVSQTIGALMLQMRMRAWIVCGRFTFHDFEFKTPLLFGTLEKIVVHELPPFLEMSIFTLPTTLVEVQVMFWELLFVHISLPLVGEVTVIVGGVEPVPLTEREVLPPLDVKATVPFEVTAEVGLNRTVTLWLSPAPRLKEPPLKMLKGANGGAALPVSVLPPVFVTVNVRSAKEPTVTAPKSTEGGVRGVTLSAGGGGPAMVHRRVMPSLRSCDELRLNVLAWLEAVWTPIVAEPPRSDAVQAPPKAVSA